MRSVEDIVDLFQGRKKAMQEDFARMQEFRDYIADKIPVPLAELDRNEKSAIANLAATGLEQMALRVGSMLPELYYPALKPGVKTSEDKARNRKGATLGWWEHNQMQAVLTLRGEYLFADAVAPVTVLPDPKTGVPTWRVRDPLACLPAPSHDPLSITPLDCVFTHQQTWASLRKVYGDRVNNLRRRQDVGPDDKFTVLEYLDHDEIVTIVLPDRRESYGDMVGVDMALELDRIPNRAEHPLAFVPALASVIGRKGKFNGTIGTHQMRAKLLALAYITAKRGAIPEPWVEPIDNASSPDILATPDMAAGTPGVIKGGRIRQMDVNPGFMTSPMLSILEREMRLAGGIPAEFGGEAACLDEETELLTTDGWRRYDELSVGDIALTLDHETGMSEWQPIQAMNIYPAEPRPMMEMEGSRHSSLSTPNHRWPVIRRNGDRVWRRSDELANNDRIPIAAMNADLPTEAKWSDALVEAVAWLYTEGALRYYQGEISRSDISQSTKNPENVERIRACLTSLFGPPTSNWRNLSGCGQGGVGHDGVPRWNESPPRENGVVRFNLSRHATEEIVQHLSDKAPTHAWLMQLTAAQLELFLLVSLLADNCGGDRFGQKVEAMSDAFAFAAILSGRAVSYRRREKEEAREGWRPGTYGAHIVRMRHRRVVKPRENALRGSSTFREVEHDGVVWCPTTPNGSWFARRRGSVYFTGNSNVRTARRGDQLISSTVDFPIQRAQNLLAKSMEYEDRAAIAIAKKWTPGRRSFYVSWKKTGWTDYDPNVDFETDEHTVSYPFAGSDLNDATIRHAQKIGTGMWSKKTARRMDPEIPDEEAESDQILAEQVEEAFWQAVMTKVADPESRWGPKQVAQLRKLIATDQKDMFEAVSQIEEEMAEEMQAPPDAMPGVAGAPMPPNEMVPIPPVEQGLANLSGQLRAQFPVNQAMGA